MMMALRVAALLLALGAAAALNPPNNSCTTCPDGQQNVWTRAAAGSRTAGVLTGRGVLAVLRWLPLLPVRRPGVVHVLRQHGDLLHRRVLPGTDVLLLQEDGDGARQVGPGASTAGANGRIALGLFWPSAPRGADAGHPATQVLPALDHLLRGGLRGRLLHAAGCVARGAIFSAAL
jgi:hypothetical protein